VVSILLHWLVATAAIGLFVLGLWMVDLGYYDPWYQRAPDLHKSIGVLLFVVVIARLAWKVLTPHPQLIGKGWERRTAAAVHTLLYFLLLALALSGYLISTADGRAIDVFGLFQVPATLSGIEGQEDIAGDIHEILAWLLIGLTVLHAAAALKHHFIDHDTTLRRMLVPADVRPHDKEWKPQ
jgi:cytochrome b561